LFRVFVLTLQGKLKRDALLRHPVEVFIAHFYFFIMQKKIFLFCLFVLPGLLLAQGMWLPLTLKKVNEKEMKSLGLKLKAEDIYDPLKPSLKDAVCLFGGGCTAEMVSPEGLLLTNHHCGFGQIQDLSTLEHNYVEDGYWAKNRAEELPCRGLSVTFIVRMEDVTRMALLGVTPEMDERSRQAQIDKNIAEVRRTTKIEKWEEIQVRPFYNGNQYFLYVVTTFRDVRLVGTPPSSIGKFGGDTDNWVWPRHTGDFSVFRVYADKDNRPAPYAADNKPYKPRHYFPISLSGVSDGDFTMVFGFPGRTDEYLSAAAVQQTGEVLNPVKVSIRDRALKAMDAFMREDAAIKIAYVAKYAGIANSWKKWSGEMQGLKKYRAVEKKRAYEAEFTRRVEANTDWKLRYGNLLPRLEQLHREIEPYAAARDCYAETCIRNAEALGQMGNLASWLKVYDDQGEAMFGAKTVEMGSKWTAFYEEYRPEVDEAVTAGMLELYAKLIPRAEWGGDFVKKQATEHGGYAGLAKHLFANSTMPHAAKMKALLAEKPAKIQETLKNDALFVFWKKLNDIYVGQVQPKLQELQPNINLIQRNYMAAQMEVFPEKRFFPDANSTLRLTYGKVRPYEPRDAVQYQSTTDLDGVMEKYVPGDYEFDLPQKLVDLWKAKDYGQYADKNGQLPVAFIGTNHTTGGNSGSPALDAKGNLIGINFDRVWEGTMSDLSFEPAICRNIMLDIRYALFVIDKVGGAKHIVDEMKLVKPKK
jgi:hypothetical protein